MQIKDEVLDRAGYCCSICRWGGAPAIVEVHHLVPKVDGGDDMTVNQIVLCPNHHALVTALVNGHISTELLTTLARDHAPIIIAIAKIAAYNKLMETVKQFDDEDLARDIYRIRAALQATIEEVKNQISS